MYDYRKMTPEQREAVVAARKTMARPWHAPPHLACDRTTYMISAACYEHREILVSPSRLSEFSEALLSGLETDLAADVQSWIVLPNHYHLLVRLDLGAFRRWVGRLHNGKATQWNREDRTPGRKVWYRFSDRRIRSERHYYASVNYIHANPVKHGYASRAGDWAWSSFHEYLAAFGRDTLTEWWKEYPVLDFGKDWD